MKIPKHILDKAESLQQHIQRARYIERQIIDWVISQGYDEEEIGESDIIAGLMYSEFNNIEDFREQLSYAMEFEWTNKMK